jgi:uncharacterized protein DUF4349
MTDQEMAAALAAARPRPSEGWLLEMEARVSAGFPRPARRRLPMPALAGGLAAVALTAAVAVVVICGDTGGNGKGASGGGGATAVAERPAPAQVDPAAARSRSTATAPAAPTVRALQSPSLSSPTAPIRPRRVERSATVALGAPAAKVDEVADGVVGVADALGGYVASSRVDSGREATFELRVPSARLSDALERLSRLGHVRGRTQASLDITSAFTAASGRVSALRAERRSLLRRLAAAVTANQAQSIKARLRDVDRALAAADRQLARVRRRANLSSVAVTVAAERRRHQAAGAWGVGDAWHDAGRVLAVAAGVALISLAAAIPVALLALLAWTAARALVRRRREHALDVA